MISQVVSAVEANKIIAILRGVPLDKVEATATALYEGGIRMMEVTFGQSSPTKLEDTAASIRKVIGCMGDDVLVGAGTVLTVEEVKVAKEAGARYIISPNTDASVIKATLDLDMASMPGAMTPSEIVAAHQYGATLVKVFPTGGLGLDYIKAVTAPLSHIPVLAVGGVDVMNLAEFLKAGVRGFGIGSNIVKSGLIREGRFDELRELAKAYTTVVARYGQGTLI